MKSPESPHGHCWRLGWPLALVAAILSYPGSPEPLLPPSGLYLEDKVIHVLVFGLLATAWLRALPAAMGVRAALIATALTIAAGAIDELRQAFLPHRSFEVADFLADALGAVVATVCYRSIPLYRRTLERPLPGLRR